MAHLKRTLTLPAAVGLAITMVVGSGLLVLPGLAYSMAGPNAIYAWILCCVAIAPLLVVFGRLGAQFPGAGGIALFVQRAFSRRAGAATEILILGTVPGGSALLIVSGNYGAAATSTGELGVVLFTSLTAVVAVVIILSGGRISGRTSQILAVALVAVLSTVSISALARHGGPVVDRSHPLSLNGVLEASSFIFFAFVGWELLSFTTEEYKNPERDFPLSIGISYAVVVVLYLLIAYAVQHSLATDGYLVDTAPFVALTDTTGLTHAKTLVAVVGYVISLSNVVAVLWAFSRLLFASAREGLMPKTLTYLSQRTKTPVKAVALAVGLFAVPAVLYFAQMVTLSQLFRMAGACFLLAYVLACISYFKIGKGTFARVVASAAVCVSLVILYGFGYLVVYPLVLFGLAFALVGTRTQKTGAAGST